MRRTIAALVALAASALPAAAEAKCTNIELVPKAATTEIHLTFPDGHPVEGVRPKLIVRRDAIRARRTDKRGIYVVDAPLPRTGGYSVDDGFDRLEPGAGTVYRFRQGELVDRTCEEEMAPVELDSPQGQLPPATYGGQSSDTGGSDGDGGVPPLGLAAGAVLILGVAGLARRRLGAWRR